MIVPDVNLLICAYNSDAPHHADSKAWWEDLLSSDEPVGLPWVATLGFIRLMTHRAVFVTPLIADRAIAHVRSWDMRPNVSILEPGPRHLNLLNRMFAALGTAGPADDGRPSGRARDRAPVRALFQRRRLRLLPGSTLAPLKRD